MSDRIGVMSQGRLLQVGDSQEIYERPASRFVADFIGDINLIEATVVAPGVAKLGNGSEASLAANDLSGDITLALRPERLALLGEAEQRDGRNSMPATVTRRTYYGDVFYYEVDAGLGTALEVKEENRPDVGIHQPGDRVLVTWRPESATVVEDD